MLLINQKIFKNYNVFYKILLKKRKKRKKKNLFS